MTKISVIVPVYNVERELERCVESICNQTYKNLEIILVDDGSTDDSGNLCDTLAQKDDRIKVKHKKNGGVADARKTGFLMSTGGVIAFVDSDDYIEPDMYEVLFNEMNQTNADIVFCDYVSVTKTNFEKRVFAKHNEILDKDKALKLLANDEIKSFMWNKLYKKEILKESDFYVGKLMEDFLCMPNIFNRCSIISYISKTFYNYVRRPNSIMGDTNILFKYWCACKERLFWYQKMNSKYEPLCLSRTVKVGLTCFENKILDSEQKNIIKTFLKSNMKHILLNGNLNLHKKLKVIYYLNN